MNTFPPAVPFEELDTPDLDIPHGDLWVFAYGSLMWNPDIPYLHASHAKIYGFHRSLCIWSWYYRGTRSKPGLVFGLDAGGSCVGRGYRVHAADREAVVDYLYRRELISNVYTPRLIDTFVDGGERVSALTFTVKREHPQYAGRLSTDHVARAVRHAVGTTGPNLDYVVNTLDHLDAMGIVDRRLQSLSSKLVLKDC
ncbi:MAG: gamma-glutamylcyclotransferase [Gammaproteobacteria bacterium]|nr:gamma-glutamylcyclotransferase [Gammaproteobacteria bacterium]